MKNLDLSQKEYVLIFYEKPKDDAVILWKE